MFYHLLYVLSIICKNNWDDVFGDKTRIKDEEKKLMNVSIHKITKVNQ